MSPNPMTTNPLFSTNHLIALFAVLLVVGAWLAWRTSARCGLPARLLIVACRVLLIAGLAILALNPGKWVDQRETQEHYWSILVDRSLSMATGDADGQSRWEAALNLAQSAKSTSQEAGKVATSTFSADFDATADLADSPDGETSDLPNAVSSLVTQSRGKPGRLTGVLVFSDGRQTAPETARWRQQSRKTALRARAQGSELFAVVLGGEVEPKDLIVEAKRRQFIAFKGQESPLVAKVTAHGLGAIRTDVILETAEGREIARQTVNLGNGAETDVRFAIDAPEPGVHLYRFRVPDWEGERIAANNRAGFSLTVLDGKIRIFMAEGAPYWDSKFLAQMIRQQENMLVSSVYRLSADRFFRVETGDERPSEATDNIFPASREELAEFDLVVMGKGAEYFLNPERIALVDEFVRERGGALLFTRGKPYSGEFDELTFLEPVRWGERVGAPFRLQPTDPGAASGLFGGLLPGRDDPLWQKLPALRDAHATLSLKPFTQVLLEGRHQVAGLDRSLPVLVSRRYGKGMILLLNADGLWKWDFFPGEESVDAQYETFWSQLIQWAVTYSEFLPGQNWALRLSETIAYPNTPIRATVTHRGGGESAAEPDLEVYRGSERIRSLQLVGDPGRSWEATLNLAEPGNYRVHCGDAADSAETGVSMPVTILAPPGERDQLSADPEFLREFAEASGGRAIDASEIPEIVAHLENKGSVVDLNQAEWQPLWDHGWNLALLLFFPALEWFVRRRSGLM